MCPNCKQSVKVCNLRDKTVGIVSCQVGMCILKKAQIMLQHYLSPMHVCSINSTALKVYGYAFGFAKQLIYKF